MDWANALAGFNDAECEALGELVWLEDYKTNAIIGSITESSGMDDVGYFKNEGCQITIKRPADFGMDRRPRANDLVELRGKVWRVNQVQSFENDSGFVLDIECLPKVQTKYPTIVPSVPSIIEIERLVGIQAEKPRILSVGILANKVSNLITECTPANPEDLNCGILPNKPNDLQVGAFPEQPSNFEAEAFPEQPSNFEAGLLPDISSELVVYTEDPNFNFPTDFSSGVGDHEIMFLERTFNGRLIPIWYEVGTIWQTTGISSDQSLVRAEDPNYPRALPYGGGSNTSSGNWAWLEITDRGTKWEFASKAE